jgi:hypothetical protein
MISLREQFEKETGGIAFYNHAGMAGTDYVEWLEQQIPIREQAAWDAAREDEDSDLPFPKQKYQSIEDWRNEK